MSVLFFMCILGCQQATVSSAQGTHLRMEMSALHQTVLFIVDGDGGIRYGGGRDAMDGKTSWHGQMSESQQAIFDDLIAASNWLELTDSNKFSPVTPHYTIRIRRGIIDQQFELPRINQAGTAVYDFLHGVSLARLEPYLNSLPKPNMDTIIHRNTAESSGGATP